MCVQGERGAAGLDGRSGQDGKPGPPGAPGLRVRSNISPSPLNQHSFKRFSYLRLTLNDCFFIVAG